jgi:ribosomal-protein-alanine N-acetyltransferase
MLPTPFSLQTPRLLLRDMQDFDTADANEYDSKLDVVRYMEREPLTLEGSLAFIQETRAKTLAQSPRRTYDLALVPKTGPFTGRMMGRVGLSVDRPEHHEATIWYVLNPAVVGQGYVTEAMESLITFGFETLKLHRIFADCDPRNGASVRVAERLHMVREAHLRENYFLRGEWCDSYIYAVLAKDWAARGENS